MTYGKIRALRLTLAAASLALFALLLACDRDDGLGGGGTTGPPPGFDLQLQLVTNQVSAPVFLLSPPGDTQRLFIASKGGTIRIVKNGALLSTPFLNVSSLVSRGGEQGLLGMAFPLDYTSSGRFYISYTDVSGNTVIARYQRSANPDVAEPAATDITLRVDQPYANHNGGMIAFGRDGMLYVGLGDGGSGGDPEDRAENRTDLLGSILRLDVRGATGYAIPSGNPFSSPNRAELWDYGLRNPWRFSFDRLNGDLYIGDVGQGWIEEINVATAVSGGGRGRNYGWDHMEGSDCHEPSSGCNQNGLTMPVVEYTHNEGNCVIGGYVYRGSALTGMAGTYFYGDNGRGWVRSFRLMNGVATDEKAWPNLDSGAGVLSFGEDAAGELYVLTNNNGVFRIVPTP